MDFNYKFVELFKKVEDNTFKIYNDTFAIDITNNISFTEALQKLKENDIYPYNKYYASFMTCKNVRNLFSHKPIDIISVNNSLYNELVKLNNLIENPLRAIDIAIKKKDIYSRNITDDIKETIKQMNKFTYTHVPIMNNNKIIGLFCERTLFNYLSNEEIVSLECIKTFEGISNYLKLENYHSTIKIVKRDLKLNEIIKIFRESFNNNQNLECLFITTDGTIDGDLLGLITIWDILGKYM